MRTCQNSEKGGLTVMEGFLLGFLPDFWDWQELAWVVGVTFTLHIGVVGILGTALVLIEHFGIFQDARIQSQVRCAAMRMCLSCLIAIRHRVL